MIHLSVLQKNLRLKYTRFLCPIVKGAYLKYFLNVSILISRYFDLERKKEKTLEAPNDPSRGTPKKGPYRKSRGRPSPRPFWVFKYPFSLPDNK